MSSSNIIRVFVAIFLFASDIFLFFFFENPVVQFKYIHLAFYINGLLRLFVVIWTGNKIKEKKSRAVSTLIMGSSFLLPYASLLLVEFLSKKCKKQETKKNDFVRVLNINKRWKVIHTIIFLIVIGLLAVILGVFNFGNHSEKWMDLLITLGSTILLAGVSSIILQIFSSIRFFQKDLVKTFYDIISADAKYLETMDYEQLRKNWKVLSRYLYDKKFAEISDDLNEIISIEYFPRDHPVYYENYRLCSKYSLLPGQENGEFVRLHETVSLDIVANSKEEEVFYDFQSLIPKVDENDTLTSNELKKFTINGADYSPKDNLQDCLNDKDFNRNGKKFIKTYYKTKLFNGSKRYSVIVEQEKVYSIKANPLKSFRAVRVLKNCFVQIQYPKELTLEFQNSGTVKKFKSLNENLENILVEQYSGLILPKQGFVISLRFN